MRKTIGIPVSIIGGLALIIAAFLAFTEGDGLRIDNGGRITVSSSAVSVVCDQRIRTYPNGEWGSLATAVISVGNAPDSTLADGRIVVVKSSGEWQRFTDCAAFTSHDEAQAEYNLREDRRK